MYNSIPSLTCVTVLISVTLLWAFFELLTEFCKIGFYGIHQAVPVTVTRYLVHYSASSVIQVRYTSHTFVSNRIQPSRFMATILSILSKQSQINYADPLVYLLDHFSICANESNMMKIGFVVDWLIDWFVKTNVRTHTARIFRIAIFFNQAKSRHDDLDWAWRIILNWVHTSWRDTGGETEDITMNGRRLRIF